MKDKTFNWDKNIFEYVLGYSADEWKELTKEVDKYEK